jgi:septum site-determining protein MinC
LTRADPAGLADDMHKMLGGRPDYFNHEPAILDFSLLADPDPGNIDWNGLLSLMRRYRLQPVGARGLVSEAHLAGARRAGLAVLDHAGLSATDEPGSGAGKRPGASAARATPAASSLSSPSAAAPSAPTLFVDRPVRSGQQIYAQGGDLVLLAGISPGSEVIADGNIHCFGPLAGRALAGARGDANARIIATCFGPELVSIAGVYRTFERGVPDAIGGRAVVVRMKPSAKNQSIIIEPLQID